MSSIHTGHANGDTQTRPYLPFNGCNVRHGTADLVGYNVRQTYARGETIDSVVIQRFEGAGKYGAAVELKNSIKAVDREAQKIIAWAVVTPLYSDGCEGFPY